MDERLDRAVKAALAELNRQHQGDREGTPYVFDDDNPRNVGIDGHVDLVRMIEAALRDADGLRTFMDPDDPSFRTIGRLER